ncbi:MAG: hypothetical protein BM564_01115 [Bacteroidetes bacterium MedPE-SWsnd-G2]|nr:MAG: hypothetical protein BM564_01115 [Bacteroidetes bacterium MedPE-SWsnd-G2]
MYNENLKFYDSLIALCPDITRKGKTMPYTSENGYMFTLLNKAGELGIRFDKNEQERLIQELNTDYFYSYGAKMKGYILIPQDLYQDKDLLVTLINKSKAYVMSLPPK